MRRTNNNFTVEALVAKYRNYVKEHCPKSVDLCEGKDGNLVNIFTPISPDGNADEQLIVTLYSSVAGTNVDMQVLSVLAKYAERFQKEALDENEFEFLCENFDDFISFEFSNRNWQGGIPAGSYVPSQNLEIIHGMEEAKEGQTVFIADAGYCDVAVLFPGCIVKGFTGYCGATMYYDEVWALGQIRLYAAGIESEIVPGFFDVEKDKYTYTLPEKESVDIVICGAMWNTECDDIQQLYELLKPNGTMFWFSDRKAMAGDGKERILREQLVNEKAIHTLASFEGDFIGIATEVIFAYIRKKNNEAVQIVSVKSGMSAEIQADDLDSDILWPNYYLSKRPAEGIPLSSIVELASNERLAKFEKGKGYILPEDAKDILLVLPNDLGESYKDANLWGKSVCYAGDPVFEKEEWAWFHVAKQPSILLCGSNNKLKVGFVSKISNKGFAYLADCCLIPKEGIDIRYAAALLLLPTVAEQILTICDGSIKERTLSLVLDKIIVPNHDEKERLSFLSETCNEAILDLRKEKDKEIEEKLSIMKADYMNEVRMRKHDMRPHLRQLASCERLMGYYIDNANNIDDLKKNLRNQLEHSHVALDSLSAIVDCLSDEEKFGTPELVNIDLFLTEIEINHDENEGFAIEYNCDKDAFRNAGFAIPDFIEQWENAKEQGIDMVKFIQAKSKESLSLLVNIAPVDFQRLVTNIIENARKHGFTDSARTDYYIGIDLTLDSEREMYQIDFSNNGNPLPEGMDKERYGIRGVKAGKTGDNGNGGYIIKSIVTHYGGDYDVFSKNGITTIRVYLPITRI